MKASRRAFLRASAAASGVLALEWTLPRAFAATQTPRGVSLRLGARLAIDATGRVSLRVGRSEMGQGVRTALPMIVAEELEVDPRSIAVESAQPGPDFPDMRTSGSGSVFTQWRQLARLGATAREMLIEAARQRWSCEREECEAREGAIVRRASGERLAYSELVESAAKLAIPRDVALKPPALRRVLGRSVPRIDGPAIVTGAASYGIDVRRPEMLYATVVRCPTFGGNLERFESLRAKTSPGVVDVVAISSGVAIVARSSWEALRARDALTVEWNHGEHASFDSAQMHERLTAALERDPQVVRDEGKFDASHRHLQALYELPFQAHAPLEPLNALADVRNDRCEVWVGTQAPNELQNELASLLELSPSAVTVNVPLLGGGFGLRLGTEFGLEAAEVSRAVKRPVQVLWTRSDTMQHAYYWPPSMHALEATLDDAGKLVAWRHRIAAPSVLRSMGVTDGMSRADVAAEESVGASDFPYAARAVRVEHVEVDNHVPLGPWRGIWFVPNVFAREAFFDELAHAAGRDPLELRLESLAPRDDVTLEWNEQNASLRRVLKRAAERAGWGRELAEGHGLGIACAAYRPRTYVAHAVEVAVDGNNVRVERVTTSAECGQVINRAGLEGTIESAIHFGLSAALLGEITFANGRVVQSSYSDFPVVRIGDAPAIDIDVVESDGEPGGMGEPPVPPLAPALVNAIARATGKRVRRLPVRM